MAGKQRQRRQPKSCERPVATAAVAAAATGGAEQECAAHRCLYVVLAPCSSTVASQYMQPCAAEPSTCSAGLSGTTSTATDAVVAGVALTTSCFVEHCREVLLIHVWQRRHQGQQQQQPLQSYGHCFIWVAKQTRHCATGAASQQSNSPLASCCCLSETWRAVVLHVSSWWPVPACAAEFVLSGSSTGVAREP